MTRRDISIRRLSTVSNRSFEQIVRTLTSTIGRPNLQVFQSAAAAARTVAEFETIVHAATGASGFMELARFDSSGFRRKERGGLGPRILRLVLGDPIIMREMARTVPDAAPYAPTTILIDERPDGVHLSYDSVASLIAPFRSRFALSLANELDAKIEGMLDAEAQ